MPSLSTVPSSSSSSTADHNSDPIPDNLPPEKDPRNSIVLAVLWVPAFFYFVFKVSIGTLFGVISYEILIVSVLISIHASFVLDENNKHKWRKKPKWMDK